MIPPRCATCSANPSTASSSRRLATLASANGAVDLALSVARAHAVKAADALEGADDLDARVCEELGSLVDGLVTRES